MDNVDYRAASLYLALTVSKQELEEDGLQQWVPKRTTTKGMKPTVRNYLMAGPLSRKERLPTTEESQEDLNLENVEWEREAAEKPEFQKQVAVGSKLIELGGLLNLTKES